MSEPGGAEKPASVPSSGPAGRLISGKLLLLGGTLLVALGFLIWTATQGAAVYYYTVDELQAMGPEAYDRLIRVNGEVVDGSIEVVEDGQVILFQIHDASGALPVRFRGSPPDLFGYSTEDRYQDVVIEGQWRTTGIFEARTLIVKHGPQFEPREIPAQ